MKIPFIHIQLFKFRNLASAGLGLLILILSMSSCKKFLDIVPDNVPTLDNAFANRQEAEKYLFTCYSYLPQEGHPEKNVGFTGGDETWIYWPLVLDHFYLDPYNIARGNQNKVNPQLNYWDSFDGRSLWQGIRVCNTFLENIDKINDLQPYEKERWIAETKFLKAYYHWYLFRMYGPIPIVDKNLPIDATPEQVKVLRQPVDSVVNYIVRLIDEAAAGEEFTGLPSKITSEATELGRVTKVTAWAIKARVLVTAASPLYNGNTELAGFKNKNGQALFTSEYDASKWTRAAEACKAAIDAALAQGVDLYTYNPDVGSVTPEVKTEMSIRNAVCEKWNKELIWGNTGEGGRPTFWLQTFACPQLDPNAINLDLKGQLAPTLKMAELFYTKNGELEPGFHQYLVNC
jgi:hypothetical protein